VGEATARSCHLKDRHQLKGSIPFLFVLESLPIHSKIELKTKSLGFEENIGVLRK
jgi:hypothetical protein